MRLMRVSLPDLACHLARDHVPGALSGSVDPYMVLFRMRCAVGDGAFGWWVADMPDWAPVLWDVAPLNPVQLSGSFNKLSYFKCVPRLASYHHTLPGQRNLAASVDCRTFRVL